MNGNIANNFGSFDVVFSSGNGSTLKDVPPDTCRHGAGSLPPSECAPG